MSGLKGNRLAAKTFVEQVEKAEGRRRAQAIEIIDIAAKYKNDWSQEIEWAKRNGVAPPVVYPHPDDLLIGADGIPYVVGPNTAAEQAEWDRLQSRARDADEAIRRELANWKSKAPRNANYKSCYFDEMVHEHRMRVNIRFAVPDEVTRRAHRYRRPTGDNIREFQIATRAKYPLHKDLPAEQVRTFIFEVEFYERKIAMFATTSR